MKVVGRFLVLLALLSFATVLAIGQTATGSVSGVVKDQSGAVVPSAKVSIVNIATQFTRAVTSNSAGVYNFTALPPGTYDVSVDASGFTPGKQRVQVTVGSANALDITLGVAGTGNTVVEVVGEGGVAVNTQDQSVSSVVSSQQIAQLPTLTRNPYDLVATAGNVTQDSQAGLGDLRGAGFAINGQRSASTDILLDGGENVDYFTATVGQQVPQDSVQEFRVISNGMTAEYGRASGGVVNVATKSGTNDLHGSAYEFNRISALASNTYDNAANGTKKPTFVRNQFGYSIGGPVLKNKLFFFNNTEWWRVRSSAPQIILVPDPAFLAASNANTKNFFSTLGKLRPGLSTLSVLTQSQVVTSLGGPGKFSGTSPFLALAATTPVFDQVTYNAPTDAGGGDPQNNLETVARVDLNLTDKTTLFGRYSLFDQHVFAGVNNTSPYVGYETGRTNYDNNFMLSLSHIFTQNIVSSTRLIYGRLNNQQPLGAAPVSPTLYMTNNRAARIGGRLVSFPGYSEYTPGNAIPFGGPQNIGQIVEDLNVIRGKHTFRFGGQYVYVQDNRVFGAYEEAVEALSTSSNTQALDNFLNGRLGQFQAAVFPQGKFPCTQYTSAGALVPNANCTVTLPVTPPSFSRSNLYNDGAAYAQDTWKILPRLTLNLGLRWEYYGVQHNKNPNLDSNFYYGAGNNIQMIANGFVATVPTSPIHSLWEPQYHNFDPRVGFAYDVFGNGKTSLRGGYGIAHERNFNNVTYNVIQNPPNYAVLSLNPSDVGGTLNVDTNNAGPLGGSVGSKPLGRTSLRAVDEHIKTSYAEQWNFGVEHEVATNTVMSLTYNGSRGIHQYSITNTNDIGTGTLYLGTTYAGAASPEGMATRINQQYSNINSRGSNGDSYYHALVASLRGNFRGIQAAANYTWSHSIDTLSSTFSDEVQNNGLGFVDPFNTAVDRASSDFDARHRLAISALWEVPLFKNSSSRLAKALLGGFQFAPIFTYHTGYPFTVFDCTYTQDAAFNCPRAFLTSGAFSKTGSTGSDQGGNNFNYLSVPADISGNQYSGPQFIPGTTTPFPLSLAAGGPGAAYLPTCTGLFHQGCSFPGNMVRRNAFNSPQVWNWDLGVYKNFKVTERVGLQLRGEFFNVLNHKNFYVVGFGQGGADVSALPTDANGLPIVQAKKGGFGNPFDDHRNTQLALRVTF